MERIETNEAPKAIGPYSQAIKDNDLVFVSGQIALDPGTGEMKGTGIEAQTTQVLENLKAVLEAAGSSMEKALKVTVYLKDMGDFQRMNAVYAGYFTGKPARATVEVSKLPKSALIEMDVIAAVK